MKNQKLIFSKSQIGKSLILVVLAMGLSGISLAQQFDAEYYNLLEQNKDEWAVDEKLIDEKLIALEKKFGLPPVSLERLLGLG